MFFSVFSAGPWSSASRHPHGNARLLKDKTGWGKRQGVASLAVIHGVFKLADHCRDQIARHGDGSKALERKRIRETLFFFVA
jgi:hypothetical protein